MNLGGGAPRVEALSHINVTQSLQGISVPILIGTNRVPGLLIWWGDWNVANAVGNGKSKGKNAQYVYSASWMAALCEGPIFGINAIWTGSGKYWPTPADPLTLNIQATPPTPTLSYTAGTGAGGTFYATITYTATAANSNDESAHSAEASLAVPANNVLVVHSPPTQSGAAGWNAYVGTSSGGETLQNTSPLAIGSNWTMPSNGSTNTGPPHPPNPVHRIPVNQGPIGADLGVHGPGGPYKRILSS